MVEGIIIYCGNIQPTRLLFDFNPGLSEVPLRGPGDSLVQVVTLPDDTGLGEVSVIGPFERWNKDFLALS